MNAQNQNNQNIKPFFLSMIKCYNCKTKILSYI